MLDKAVSRASFNLAVTRRPDLIRPFYEIRFERHPQVRPMVGRHSAAQQEEMLASALVAVVENVEDGAWLTGNLQALGRLHIGDGVTADMYPWVGECLVASLAEASGDDGAPAVQDQWVAAYGAITGLTLS
jgi:hemoglobin-like flavoprotein